MIGYLNSVKYRMPFCFTLRSLPNPGIQRSSNRLLLLGLVCRTNLRMPVYTIPAKALPIRIILGGSGCPSLALGLPRVFPVAPKPQRPTWGHTGATGGLGSISPARLKAWGGLGLASRLGVTSLAAQIQKAPTRLAEDPHQQDQPGGANNGRPLTSAHRLLHTSLPALTTTGSPFFVPSFTAPRFWVGGVGAIGFKAACNKSGGSSSEA